MGAGVLDSPRPGQQVIKIVHDELAASWAGRRELPLASGRPDRHHDGRACRARARRRTCAQAGALLRRTAEGRSSWPCDIQRPAAIDQLETLGRQLEIDGLQRGHRSATRSTSPSGAVDQAERRLADVVILDTAGRLHDRRELMDELAEIKRRDEAPRDPPGRRRHDRPGRRQRRHAFDEALELQRRHPDQARRRRPRRRGALGLKAVTGKPIKFVGVGEKLDDFEPFHPERMASRILGMGDVVSLVEKAAGGGRTWTRPKRMEEKMRKGSSRWRISSSRCAR